MKIGIDASAMLIAQKNGYENYTTSLISALAELLKKEFSDLDIYLYFYVGNVLADISFLDEYLPKLEQFPKRIYRYKPGYKYFLTSMTIFDRLDWIHLPVYMWANWFPCKVISTFHDACTKRLHEKGELEHEPLNLKYMIRTQLRISDAFVAVSESSKNDLAEFYGVPEEKISVVHHGLDPIFKFDSSASREVEDVYNLSPYILSVNAIQGNKNHIRLLRAFAHLRNEKNIPQILVLVGRDGWGCESIYGEIDKLNLGNSVRRLGFVPTDHLIGLYSGADLVVNPSLCEGFGLTILEALACDAIVAASNSTSLPEVGGQAVGYFDPYNVSSIADMIFRLLTEEKERIQLRKNSREQLDKFTWQKAAKDTVDVYRSLI